MLPEKIKDRPLLYFGDVSSFEQEMKNIESLSEEGVAPLTPFQVLVNAIMFPAIILHEMTHYVTAKLLGLDVRGVILFQFSTKAMGVVIIPGGEIEGKTFKQHIIKATPILTCGPVWLWYMMGGYQYTSEPFWLFCFMTLIMAGFFVNAIPDQLRGFIPF